MKEDTPAKRAYSIRLALGDGWKVAMPMAAFAALLSEQEGAARYDSSIVSRIESGDRKLTLDDAPIFAAVDPLRRGPAWVAWGDEKAPAGEASAIERVMDNLRPVTETREEDEAEVARLEATRAAAKKTVASKKRANGGKRRA